VATYAQLLKENPGSAAAFSWALGYWGAVKEQKVTTADTKLIESAVTHFEKALTDPMRDALGFSKTDLYLLRAEAVALLGNHEKTKLMWKEAAEFLDTSAKALPQGMTDRGFRLEEIWALDSAGEVDKALALSQKYREKFPNEFTFHYVAGSILERRKKPAEALPLAQRAVDTGYGDNRIRAATLLVKCLAATGGVSEAKKVQAQIHKEFPIDTKLEVRTHRYLKQLDDTMQKVQNL
jgi:tetratricopeptide (TPR) repeat protein